MLARGCAHKTPDKSSTDSPHTAAGATHAPTPRSLLISRTFTPLKEKQLHPPFSALMTRLNDKRIVIKKFRRQTTSS